MPCQTRETGRWVIPKGWPEKGLPDWRAAEIEALEEAGLNGTIPRKPIGTYPSWKRMAEHFELVELNVYVLETDEQLADWPEKAERERHWLAVAAAAEEVLEPGLITIINALEGITKQSHGNGSDSDERDLHSPR